MTDEEFTYPAFVIEIKNERNMADEERAMCEECERDADDLEGQMQIEDFLEVLP